MRNRRTIRALLLAGLAIGFGFGVVKLFQLRFEAGDVYPPYSSLRTDPLGAKAFYESLERIDGLSVSRNFRRELKPQAATFFVLGLDQWALHDVESKDLDEIEAICNAGGRVVLSLMPGRSPLTPHMPTTGPGSQRVSTGDRWGFTVGNQEIGEGAMARKTVTSSRATTRRHTTAVMPPLAGTQLGTGIDSRDPTAVSWHCGVYFDRLKGPWRTLYSCNGKSVIIQRPLGKGTLAISGDSFFFSNEALRRERHADLLAAMLGGNSTAVFDEYHLGVQEEPGVAALARKYRLGYVLAAVVVVAALFIWKNARSLTPPLEDEAQAAASVSGKASGEGLLNLLRRTIPPSELLSVCFAEWLKNPSGHGDPRTLQEKKLPKVRQIMQDYEEFQVKHRDVAGTYRLVARALKR